jgi:hypothetical protein
MDDVKENQQIQEDLADNVPLQKAKKEKKPRSEKQLAHFENMAQKRKDSIEKKKLEKKIESAKLLIEHDIQVAPSPVKSKNKKVYHSADGRGERGAPAVVEEEDESDDESVQEVVIKRKPKKKAKKIIVYQESESESEEEEEEEEQKPQSRKLKTQQNKKSIVKVYQNETAQQKQIHRPSVNCFCD